MYHNSNINIPIYSDSTWIPFIAKADFWGDSRASQLSFRRDAHLLVDRNLNPQNGWRWGKIGQRMGWFPEWAAEPTKSQTVSPRRRRTSIGRSKDRIVPMMEKISEERARLGYEADETDGFNLSSNSIMGGSTVSTADSSTDEEPAPRKRFARRSTVGPSWKDKLSAMAAVGENPYTKDQKQLDWDGSEIPQIVGGDGSLIVVGNNGETSSYRSERSYKISDSKNRLAEKMGLKLTSSSKGSKSRRFGKFSSMPEFLKKSKPEREQSLANDGWESKQTTLNIHY